MQSAVARCLRLEIGVYVRLEFWNLEFPQNLSCHWKRRRTTIPLSPFPCPIPPNEKRDSVVEVDV
jgi:hypothetical protein